MPLDPGDYPFTEIMEARSPRWTQPEDYSSSLYTEDNLSEHHTASGPTDGSVDKG